MAVSGLLWWMVGEAFAGTCGEPVSADALNKMIADADAAFLASQSEAVPPVAAKLNEALACADALNKITEAAKNNLMPLSISKDLESG